VKKPDSMEGAQNQRILPVIVDDRGHDLAVGFRVAPQLILHQPPRGVALPFHQLAEEPFGRAGVAIPLSRNLSRTTISIREAVPDP
jgi:hypothetical protein